MESVWEPYGCDGAPGIVPIGQVRGKFGGTGTADRRAPDDGPQQVLLKSGGNRRSLISVPSFATILREAARDISRERFAMTQRSVVTSAFLTLAILATGACSGGGIAPDNVLSAPLVDVNVTDSGDLPPAARAFYEALLPINATAPTPRPVRGSAVYEGRSLIGSESGRLNAFGDARMEVDFDRERMTARFDGFVNHDSDGLPIGPVSGAIEVRDGTAAGPGFFGDMSGRLTEGAEVFDVTGSVEGRFGGRGAPVAAGLLRGTVSGSDTGLVGGVFYGERP
jgi:hypothetical protein